MSIKTTSLSEMTIDELWVDAEMWLDGIESTLSRRCYSERSMIGMRSIQLDVRKHLIWIDQVLREIEIRASRATERERSGI